MDTNHNPDGRGYSALDTHFAQFIARISGDGRDEVLLAAALASQSVGDGNICLDLRDLCGMPARDAQAVFPPCDRWLAVLMENKAVGRPGDLRPLILDDKARLYLYRYWDYERKLSDFIGKRVKEPAAGAALDLSLVREKLGLLFPHEHEGEADWQKIAAAAALMNRFTVISGSPGTGKTTTVTKIMALLLELAGARKLSLAMAAPTGKAAARLQEAVKNTRELLPCAETIKAALPEKATTLHRLLGSLPDSPYFRYNRDNPLPFDVVIVDEASMVDLPLMAKLVEALPETAKLILTGDKDQLTSVEAGAVLGDICGLQGMDIFSREFMEKLEQATGDALEGIIRPGGSGMNNCLVQLKKNYRFGEASGIGQVSAAVNDGDAARTLSLLRSGDYADIGWRDHRDSLLLLLKERAVEGFGDYLRAIPLGDPEEIFALFDSFRILCALRQGPSGVEGINGAVERLLADAGLIEPGRRWYPGRPVMIMVNDYQQRLFNGDVGIILPDAEGDYELRAFFRDASGRVRKFHPLRLPQHETVYAMTVHKSQGSEFQRVLLILPDRDVPLLTRELVYTGLTRAKNSVELWCPEEVLRVALSRRIKRASGLSDAIWGAEGL